jgi:hypothetical protein
MAAIIRRKKLKLSERNSLQYHFVHYKSHVSYTKSEGTQAFVLYLGDTSKLALGWSPVTVVGILLCCSCQRLLWRSVLFFKKEEINLLRRFTKVVGRF